MVKIWPWILTENRNRIKIWGQIFDWISKKKLKIWGQIHSKVLDTDQDTNISKSQAGSYLVVPETSKCSLLYAITQQLD